MRERLLTTTEGSNLGDFSLREWGLLAGTASIWGTSYLWIELALRGLGPGLVSFLRVALGVATLVCFRRARRPIESSDWGRIVLLGIGWMALPMIAFPIAQQWVDSSLVGMLNGANPILTTLSASLLLRRRPGSRQVAGVSVGVIGVIAISAPTLRGVDAEAFGVALILGSMAVNAVLVNLLVPLQQRYGALPVMLRTLAVAAVVTAPFGLLALPASTARPGPLLALIPLGVLSTGLAFAIWTMLTGWVGAARASAVSFLTPLVAVLVGVVILGERLGAMEMTGMALVLIGAGLMGRRDDAAIAVVPLPPAEDLGVQHGLAHLDDG